MLSAAWPLLGLWLSGFTSATLLPGNSEVALVLYLKSAHPLVWPALLSVTVGNVLGGLTTVLMARALPSVRPSVWLERVRRHGAVITVLAPLPIIGDVIAAAAGWLRLPLLPVLSWMLLGRAARYLLIVWMFSG